MLIHRGINSHEMTFQQAVKEWKTHLQHLKKDFLDLN